MLAFLALLTSQAAAPSPVTDAQVRAYAHASFDKRALMGRREVLGMQGVAAVVADHPCSDICPDYTRRIVHLLAPMRCEDAGGVIRDRLLPQGIAVMPKPYGVPRALADDPF